MMTEKFTVEETNLICVFSKNSRNALIAELNEAIPDFDEHEPEMTEIAEAEAQSRQS